MADERTPDEIDATAYSRRQQREAFIVRRGRKIREEIERNRRGDYKVPTWVLAVVLVAFLAAWAAWVLLA